jgi:hypothetical protein
MSPEDQRDDRLGAALSDLDVPDHGPTFWADLDHRLQGERTVLNQTESVTVAGPGASLPAETVSLDDHRARHAARRGGRLNRSLGAAAAAVALIVAVAGALTVIRQDGKGTEIRAAERPTGTTSPGTTAMAAPAEFSATYEGVQGLDGPDGCCSEWRLTLARDGSYRLTSTDNAVDIAYDATTGRHVQIARVGAAASAGHPRAFITTGVPAGGPDRRIARPELLDPIADFVVGLARANDPRITSATVAGRDTWHYDGPTVRDRLGGDGAPDHAVVDVDKASGVLLSRTTKVGNLVVNSFTASNVTVSDAIDRSRYQLEPPATANRQNVAIGFVPESLDEAAAGLPYDFLVPGWIPEGFTLESVSIDRDVPTSTGPEGMNPPAKQVVALTWVRGADRFAVTLRPKGADQWDDPFGAEGMVPDARDVSLPLAGRAPLDGKVVVDAPFVPHLWGITGDIVVTVSGDLPPAELERVAGSLQPHRS